jgi:hypothetical protein
VDIRDQGQLDARLDKFPHVDQSFFGGKSRVFLTLPEALDRVEQDSPFFPAAVEVGLKGREEDLEKFADFLGSKSSSFLVISGPGGVGKTRFLLEAGFQASTSWQVLWGDIAAMERGDWFSTIIPEQPTLLLIDDPEDEKVLRLLVGQVGGAGARTNKWKVAVTVRSPKDAVIDYLRRPEMDKRKAELPLQPLDESAARAACLALLDAVPDLRTRDDSWKELAVKKIASLSRSEQRHLPVWIVMSVHVLQKDQDLGRLPEESARLAALYLKEAYAAQGYDPKKVNTLVRWIALLGVVNVEDQNSLDLLRRRIEFTDHEDLMACLKSLVRRQVLVQGGAWNRRIQLKPDVLRDHVLRTWLISDDKCGANPIRPTSQAEQLCKELAGKLKQGSIDGMDRAILRSLARTEWIARHTSCKVDLLAPFFEALLTGIPEMSATARRLAAEVLVEIGVPRPGDVAKVARQLRELPCEPETVSNLFGSRTVGKADVVFHLAWTVYHAAMGAREPGQRRLVMRELCALVEDEIGTATEEHRTLPNDGKRAAQLLERLLEGGPQFPASFEIEGLAEGQRLLQELQDPQPLSEGRLRLLQVVVKALTAVHRHRDWFEDNKIIWESYAILPDSEPWRVREELLGSIKRMLEGTTLPATQRADLWKLLVEAHRSAVFASGQQQVSEKRDPMREALLEDLRWAGQVLTKTNRPIQEIKAARELWKWHYRHDPDRGFKEAATHLEEEIYLKENLAQEFEPLCGFWEHKEIEQAARERANHLADAGTPDEIAKFVGRASDYLGGAANIGRVFSVATELGTRASTAPSVADFIRASLAESAEEARFDFAAQILRSWLLRLRAAGDAKQAAQLAEGFTQVPQQAVHRVRLLQHLYGSYYPSAERLFAPREHDVIRASVGVFLDTQNGPSFLSVVGWTFGYQWEQYKAVVRNALKCIPADQLPMAMDRLSDAIYWGITGFKNHEDEVPRDLGIWLLDQFLLLPDLDVLAGTEEWHLEEILKVAPRPDVVWLLAALENRAAVHRAELRQRAFPFHRLSRFVRPVDGADANTSGVRTTVAKLLEFIISSQEVAGNLEEYAGDVDPNGLVVPEIVAEHLKDIADPQSDDFWRWSRIGGAYFPNPTPEAPWRTIAKVVCRYAQFAEDERRRSSLFYCLRRSHHHTFAGSAVDYFGRLVDKARRELDAETDADIKRFWEWNLAAAQAELSHWSELEKERDMQ